MSIFVGCVCGTSPLERPPLGNSVVETPYADDGGTAAIAPDPVPPDPVVVTGQVCQTIGLDPSLPPRIVDIIMAIDNSGSMTEEITSVQSTINAHFAEILAQGGIDYRVILVSLYGPLTGVCIPSPLGGSDCNPPPSVPMNGARFFHYDQKLDDKNSLYELLLTYGVTDPHFLAPGGWKSWLRSGSLKAFIEVTGGESTAMTADAFESGLFSKGVFGTASDRDYIFHSIVGVPTNIPTTAPWPSTAPLMSTRCSTAGQPGTQYQNLSIRSGGLRFSFCDVPDYGAGFEAIARDIATAAGVRCDFTPPSAPAGSRYDTAVVEFTPTGGSLEQFALVTDPTACTAAGFLRDATTDRVTLCPQACFRLRSDPSATIAVKYSCATGP